MKVFALVLLCALVAVQARNTGVAKSSRAALGDAPSVVHIRYAHGTSGLLRSCIGTLVSNRWVLSAASCINDYRFGWFRFGAVDVIRPSLVIEAGLAAASPTFDSTNTFVLLNLNRNLEFTENIGAAALGEGNGSSGNFCVYGADDNGNAGEALTCAQAGEASATSFDRGAGLVDDGALVAVLTAVDEDGAPTFTPIDAAWIRQVAGL